MDCQTLAFSLTFEFVVVLLEMIPLVFLWNCSDSVVYFVLDFGTVPTVWYI